MSQRLYPPLLTHPTSNLVAIIPLDYGFKHAPCLGDTWFPFTSISFLILPTLMNHPLWINCSFRRHASGLIQLCAMASSRSFVHPLLHMIVQTFLILMQSFQKKLCSPLSQESMKAIPKGSHGIPCLWSWPLLRKGYLSLHSWIASDLHELLVLRGIQSQALRLVYL